MAGRKNSTKATVEVNMGQGADRVEDRKGTQGCEVIDKIRT